MPRGATGTSRRNPRRFRRERAAVPERPGRRARRGRAVGPVGQGRHAAQAVVDAANRMADTVAAEGAQGRGDRPPGPLVQMGAQAYGGGVQGTNT